MIMRGIIIPAISISSSTWHSLPSLLISIRCLTVGSQNLGFNNRYDDDHHHTTSINNWNKFYKQHQNKFFKDRHYLEKDWGQYFADDNTVPSNGKVVLEVGCGAGNTIFPLVAAFPKIFVYACDFSPHAITLVKSHLKFNEEKINVFVCDIASEDLCDYIKHSSVDVVTLVFTLSAVSPNKMPLVIQNLQKVLKPNGYVLVRDYAVGDFAQVKLQNRNQIISENFYFRGDGTSSFYFSEDFLSKLFLRGGFNVVDVNTYCREIENRSRNITMPRRWIRAVFSQA